MGFTDGALEYLKPFLSPLYAWVASVDRFGKVSSSLVGGVLVTVRRVGAQHREEMYGREAAPAFPRAMFQS